MSGVFWETFLAGKVLSVQPNWASLIILVSWCSQSLLFTSSVKQSTATYQPVANMNNSNTNTGNKKSKKIQQGHEYPSLSIVGFQRIGP